MMTEALKLRWTTESRRDVLKMSVKTDENLFRHATRTCCYPAVLAPESPIVTNRLEDKVPGFR